MIRIPNIRSRHWKKLAAMRFLPIASPVPNGIVRSWIKRLNMSRRTTR